MARPQPVKTERLLLEPFSEKFLTRRYVAWLNDDAVTAFSRHRHGRNTIASCREYFNGMLKAGNVLWAMIVRDDPSLGHIGNIAAYLDRANGIADVTILIGEPAAQGRGYASDAWLAACDWLFEKAGMRKITAGTMETNAAMLAIMKRAGMVEDGRRARHFLQGGGEVDLVYAALFREDWLARRGLTLTRPRTSRTRSRARRRASPSARQRP